MKTVPKVSIALLAIILRRLQVQRHHLVALSRVFQCPSVRRFDLNACVLAVDACRSLSRSGVDFDTTVSFYSFDLKVRYA